MRAGVAPQAVASTPVTTVSADVPSTSSSAPAVPVTTQAVAPVKCNWTEHTSPDGYKYYYNGVSGESRVRREVSFLLLSFSSVLCGLIFAFNEPVVGET